MLKASCTRRRVVVLVGGALGAAVSAASTAAPAAASAVPGESAVQTAAQGKIQRRAAPLPVPQRALLLSIDRAGNRLVAVGEQGTVVLSDDDGVTWRSARQIDTAATLTQVRFADARSGWAVGHLGVVLHTDDGGEQWRRVLDGERSAEAALAEARSAGAPLLRVREAEQLLQDGPDKPLLDLMVRAAGSATVVGAFNTAYRTDDAGRTWREVRPLQGNPRQLHLYGVAVDGADELLVGEAGLLLSRSAHAREGRVITTPSHGTFSGILVLQPRHWVVYGLKGRVLRTEDAGASWAVTQVPGEATVNCAARLGPARLAIGDQTGRVFISDDAGATFRTVLPGGPPVTGLVTTREGGLVTTTLMGVSRVSAASLNAR